MTSWARVAENLPQPCSYSRTAILCIAGHVPQREQRAFERLRSPTWACSAPQDLLRDPSVDPGVVLVEEAGELLEAHTLTSLSPRTKHLIMVSVARVWQVTSAARMSCLGFCGCAGDCSESQWLCPALLCVCNTYRLATTSSCGPRWTRGS